MYKKLHAWYRRVDRAIMRWLHAYSLLILRCCLGLVFVWFGALKVLGVSPAAEMVAQTVFWLPAWFAVPFIGWWEIVIGLGLLAGKSLRLILLLMFVQQLGTFLALLVLPNLMFGGNVFLLTMDGEFVIKNLVLVSAGLVVGASLDARRESSRT